MQSNEAYNNFNFSIDLFRLTQDYGEEELNKHFLLMDSDLKQLDRNQTLSLKTNGMIFYIVYACFSDCKPEETNDDMFYIMDINYPGYKIDHQNKTTPLEKNDNNTFTEVLYFNYDKMSIFEINFDFLKYKEEKGLLGLFDNWMNKKNEYNCISIGSVKKNNAQTILDMDEGEEGYKEIIKILSVIIFDNDNYQIEEYVRKKRSPLDVLANIGSLFSTLFTVFSFLFKFYSRKNNNYTIIKELLSNPKAFTNSSPNINILKSKTIKFENYSNKNKDYLNFDKKSIDTSKSVPFKSEENNIINKNIKISKNNSKEQSEQNDENFYLCNIYFFDFLINNIICKNNKKKKRYKIIDVCDEIMCKYTSVDNILYNQIIIENLLKDYIWNKPFLKKFDYNVLISKLKSIN